MGRFIIQPPPSQERGLLGTSKDGFLYKDKKIYVMGNHRLALWCWLQIDDICNQDYELIHIDGHFDCSSSFLANDMHEMPDSIEKLKDIEYYRGLKYEEGLHKITWDTFLSVAIKAGLFSYYHFFVNHQNIKDLTLFNNKWLGITKDQYDHCPDVKSAMNAVGSLLKESSRKYVLDIDLDYFYEEPPRDVELKVSLEDTERFFTKIKERFDNVVSMTIALSFNEDWEERYGILDVVKSIFNLDISI